MRWPTVGGGDSDGALFDADALADRHVGRGEPASLDPPGEQLTLGW